MTEEMATFLCVLPLLLGFISSIVGIAFQWRADVKQNKEKDKMRKTVFICDCCGKEFDPSTPTSVSKNVYLSDKIVNPCIIVEGNYYDNTATPFTKSYEVCSDCAKKIIDMLTKGE